MKKLFICLLFMIGLASASSVKDSLQFFETDYLIAGYMQGSIAYFILPNIPIYNSSNNLMIILGNNSTCSTDNVNMSCDVEALDNIFPHNLKTATLGLGYIKPQYDIPSQPVHITITIQYSISGVVFYKSMTYEVDFFPFFQGQGGDVSVPTLASPIMFQTSPLNVQSTYNNEPQYFMKCFGEQSFESSPYIQMNSGSSKVELLDFIDTSSNSISCFPMIATINDDTHLTLSANFIYDEYVPNNYPITASQESSTEIHLIH